MQISVFGRRWGAGATGLLAGFLLAVALAGVAWKRLTSAANRHPGSAQSEIKSNRAGRPRLFYEPRRGDLDISGFKAVDFAAERWKPDASLEDISESWQRVGFRGVEWIDQTLNDATAPVDRDAQLRLMISQASFLNYEGEPHRAGKVLEELRSNIEANDSVAESVLYSIIFFQGVTALRCGETDNCIMCRGESSCILPISSAAVHTNPTGSRQAVRYFTEYLEEFPDDLEVRWLLNLAHMTLGEHPHAVDSRFVLTLDRYMKSEFDIGRFRDVGHLVGVNRFNQAGGAIMEDFDNDGLLDIAITTFDATSPMALFRNTGGGTFEDRTSAAGLMDQLGGLYCVQTDYNNDGSMDIFVVRGAWRQYPMRPSLLRNDGNGSFTDVTREAGLIAPVNSITASWADYDNDGWLDLFICCEKQASRLYHNQRDGTFQEVARSAGVVGNSGFGCKGAAWIDYDNDDYPDLFLNYFTPQVNTRLFRNNRNGTFTDVTSEMNIDGPADGFSCWAWDYDNDGWLDIFATCYDRPLGEAVKGLLGQPHSRNTSRLYRNDRGLRFEDQTREAGLDMVFATMGSNFGDFDNDGFLDMYLGTGDPTLELLIPNRMFKNVGGRRFAEITASSGTGHLQKGHGVACGDWDRDGDVDVFIEMGGATNGDKYHNILFQNPGQQNHWLTLKLVGQKTNRAAIGARIKVVTAGTQPLTAYRHVSSGSSFGGNPLQQTIGLAKAERISLLEIHWPASGTTQTFRDVAVDQAILVTEFSEQVQVLDWAPIPLPSGR